MGFLQKLFSMPTTVISNMMHYSLYKEYIRHNRVTQIITEVHEPFKLKLEDGSGIMTDVYVKSSRSLNSLGDTQLHRSLVRSSFDKDGNRHTKTNLSVVRTVNPVLKGHTNDFFSAIGWEYTVLLNPPAIHSVTHHLNGKLVNEDSINKMAETNMTLSIMDPEGDYCYAQIPVDEEKFIENDPEEKERLMSEVKKFLSLKKSKRVEYLFGTKNIYLELLFGVGNTVVSLVVNEHRVETFIFDDYEVSVDDYMSFFSISKESKNTAKLAITNNEGKIEEVVSFRLDASNPAMKVLEYFVCDNHILASMAVKKWENISDSEASDLKDKLMKVKKYSVYIKENPNHLTISGNNFIKKSTLIGGKLNMLGYILTFLFRNINAQYNSVRLIKASESGTK